MTEKENDAIFHNLNSLSWKKYLFWVIGSLCTDLIASLVARSDFRNTFTHLLIVFLTVTAAYCADARQRNL